VRFLDDRELARLLEALREEPKWMHAIVLLALSTGMRQSEILGLRRRDIDIGRRRVVLHVTKNGERRGVPLTTDAATALAELMGSGEAGGAGVDEGEPVFPPYHRVRDAWYRVIKRAKVSEFRFHDLRHTAASYLAMTGATPSEIAGVLGHKTLTMVKRYAHLSDPHQASVVDRMSERFLKTKSA